MFVIVKRDSEQAGAFSICDDEGSEVVLIFVQEDDAIRYCSQLEDIGFPPTKIMEFDDVKIIKMCELMNQKYTIITPHDIVVPPDDIDLDNIL
jgi:hypothetical protein